MADDNGSSLLVLWCIIHNHIIYTDFWIWKWAVLWISVEAKLSDKGYAKGGYHITGLRHWTDECTIKTEFFHKYFLGLSTQNTCDKLASGKSFRLYQRLGRMYYLPVSTKHCSQPDMHLAITFKELTCKVFIAPQSCNVKICHISYGFLFLPVDISLFLHRMDWCANKYIQSLRPFGTAQHKHHKDWS